MKKLLLIILFFSLSTTLLYSQEKLVKNGSKPESEITAVSNPQNPDQLITVAMYEASNGQVENQNRLSIYRSSDRGESWLNSDYDGKLTTDAPETYIVGDPVLAYDDLNKAYLAHIIWEGTNTNINTQLYVATSNDHGENWTPQLLRSGIQQIYDKPWISSDLSPTSPYYNQVYITFSRVDVDGNQSSSGIYLIRKTVGDDNFETETIKVNTGDFRITQFSNIAIDQRGIIYVCFVGNDGSQTGIYVAKSEDGGKSFKPEKQIVRLGMYYSNFQVLVTILNQKGLERLYPCPQIAVDRSGGQFDGRVYVSWTDIEEHPIEYGLDVFLSYSDDKGDTWRLPNPIHPEAPINNHQFYASMNVHPNGLLLMGWYDRREDDRNEKTHYYFALSRDGGETFEEERVISSKSSDFSRIGQQNKDFGIGEYTQLITAGEYALSFWADGRTNNGDVNIYMGKIKVDEATAIFEGNSKIHSYVFFHPPFPNPVKDVFNVGISLEKSSKVSLNLYDLQGKKIRTFLSQYLGVGEHSFEFRRTNIASGNYILELETAYGNRSRKIALVGNE